MSLPVLSLPGERITVSSSTTLLTLSGWHQILQADSPAGVQEEL